MSPSSLAPHRYVVLPWAHPTTHPGQEHVFQAINRAQVAHHNRALRASKARLAAEGEPSGDPSAASEGPITSAPTLALPSHLPPPLLPPGDRPEAYEEEFISAAVVLDILSTGTRSLPTGPAILSRLTEVLVSVGELSGATAEHHQALLDQAGSPQGERREQLATLLSQAVEPEESPPEEGPPRCAATPRGIRHSLEAIEAMAELAVHQAHLLLESQQVIEYRQA